MFNPKKTVYSLCTMVAVMAAANMCLAALLGILPGFPAITYNGTGSLNYTAGSNLYSVDASPISIRLSNVSPPRIINPTGVPAAESLSIRIQVDNSGNLIGGQPGDDLQIVGQVDINGDTIIDYAGVLLTGEIMQFGHLDTGTNTDRFDYRFSLTGGLLASLYAGQDIGVTLSSENSNFVGDFTVDFTGGAKGNVGGLPRLNEPPFCNANGPYESECAGASTVIQLDGTQSSDPDNDQLTYSWTTDCQGATFDNPTSSTPILTIDTSGSCNLNCTVSLTVSDGTATSAPCVAQISVSDSNAPTITCDVPELTVACGDPTDTDPPVATDDCDPAPVVTSADVETPGDCAQEKTITRTWTATDRCGNHASCEQIIHVVDEIAPTITCPPEITVNCSQTVNPSVTGNPTVSDNCDPQPTVTFTDESDPGCCPIVAVITRTWKAVDACGNESTCTQTIKVRDNSAPTITCPPNKIINCGESKNPSNTGRPTVSDTCDPNPTLTYCDSVCGTCPKIITRKWKATDACGNSAYCTQYITINDTIPPTICCPPDKTLTCGQSTDPCNTGRASASDNCDTCVQVWYTDSVSGCGCPRTITRTWKAKDDCGNISTCTQIITVGGIDYCPNTPGYWKNHRSAWPVSSLQVGCVTYNDTKLMRLLSNKLPNGADAGSDASAMLAKFVISATFNILDGSNPQNIQAVLDDANDFLCDYPPGSNPRNSARSCALQLKDRLDAYCNSNPSGCRERN